MPIVTLNNLKDRFGETLLIRLTDDENLGVIDAAKVDRAVAAVAGLIDGYLRDRYPLPISTIPAELASYAEDLVLERLYSGRPEREPVGPVQQRANDARAWLREVQKGNANLSIEIVPSPDKVESNEKVATGAGLPGAFPSGTLDRF